jgi:hypothetical protein
MKTFTFDWRNAPVRKHLSMVRDFALALFAIGACVFWVFALAL